MTTPVHVIGGFLGAGKTTAVLGLLRRRPVGERVAVVVNDFGDAAIDDAVVTSEVSGPVRIAEIRGGCVCCTAPENFGEAIRTLLDDVRPDRILVEPTGLARPADLVDALRRGPQRDRVDVRPVVVLVDPTRLHEPLVVEQAEAADVLVANRVDLAGPEDLAAFNRLVAGLWPGPMRVIKTRFGELDADVLDWTTPPVFRGHHDHDHPSTEGFDRTSRVWPPSTVFSRSALVAEVTRLAAHVARLKGLFRTDEGTILLEVAGGRVHERASSYRRDSRVDVIFPPGKPVREELDRAVRAGVDATDAVEVVLPDGSRKAFGAAALAALPDGVPDVGTVVPKRAGVAARVDALLRAAGAPDGATVVVVAHDGLATAPVAIASLATALLVYRLGDGPLPEAQGGPYRLLVPGDTANACANVKGVARIVTRAGG